MEGWAGPVVGGGRVWEVERASGQAWRRHLRPGRGEGGSLNLLDDQGRCSGERVLAALPHAHHVDKVESARFEPDVHGSGEARGGGRRDEWITAAWGEEGGRREVAGRGGRVKRRRMEEGGGKRG